MCPVSVGVSVAAPSSDQAGASAPFDPAKSAKLTGGKYVPRAHAPTTDRSPHACVNRRSDTGRASPEHSGRTIGKRVGIEQREHRRAALEQPEHEVLKPRVRLRLAERGEPHLPVESRLVRNVPERRAGQLARLVGEAILGPGWPSAEPSITISGRDVVMTANSPYALTMSSGDTALEDVPSTGRSVRVTACQIRFSPTGTTTSASAVATVVAAPRMRRPRLHPRREPSWQQTAQRRVVEQEDAHDHAEQVEEIVVAGQQDQRLEEQQRAARSGARAPRQEDEKDASRLRRRGSRSFPRARSHCGSCAAYQASGVGSGCVQK